MLEIIYDKATKEVRGWNADMKVKGNLKLKEGQAIVIFPIDPPDIESDWYKVDLAKQILVSNPDYIAPEPFDVKKEIKDIKDKLDNVEIKINKHEGLQ